MAISLDINGVTYQYPEVGDVAWGPDATDWAVAVTSGMLQKAGGLFQLLAETDFGSGYGVKSLYYKSRTTNPAAAGQIRLARADTVSWRNEANDGDLALSVNSSNVLQFNGSALGNIVSVSDTATIDLTLTGTDLTADIRSDSITNAMINSAAAIAYSKLALTGSIVNADINASAAIAYSKLALTGSIVNADINASAAIAYSKLALSNSIVNADINSAAAIAYSKLNLATSIVNADISASAAIAFSKLATLSSANILLGSAGNVATSTAVTGDVTIGNTGVTAIGANKVTNSQLAQMATLTIKGNNTGGASNPIDLTVAQTTAILNAFVGDSGSGGTKGLVPAPTTGDGAKYLKGDGTWDPGTAVLPTAMSDSSASALGYKTYYHGTTYNGGIAPTITLAAGGGSLSSVIRGEFTPVQRQDGTWKLIFHIGVSVSSTSRTNATLAINAVTFKNTANFFQPFAPMASTAISLQQCYADPNTANLSFNHAASTTTAYYATGEAILESKPSWVY